MVNKMELRPRLPYAAKLDTWLELAQISDKTFYEMIGEKKSYFYNVIKKGRLISAHVCKKIEERLGIKFKASDFDWQETLR